MSSYYQGYGTYYGRNPRVVQPLPPVPYGPNPPVGTGPYQPTPKPPPVAAPSSAPDFHPEPQAPSRPSIDFGNIDYSDDPILSRVKAAAQEAIGQANAEARANRTRLAIGFGDSELAKQLGLGGKVERQAAENTFGTLQELGRQLTRRDIFEIDRPLSDQANLFYSTERARQRALCGTTFLRDKATAQHGVQDKLATISQRLVAIKMEQQQRMIQAEQEAYGRALQRAAYAAGLG